MIYFRGKSVKTGKYIESRKVDLRFSKEEHAFFYIDGRWVSVEGDSVEVIEGVDE